MTAPGNAHLFHATALVVGTRGFLVTGPSGSGKSALALRLIAEASLRGFFARLVSDDQVLLEIRGGRLLAHAPAAIAGFIECRGSGVFTVPYIDRIRLHYAIAPASPAGAERVPPEDETLEPMPEGALPVIRLLYGGGTDPLAALAAILGRFD